LGEFYRRLAEASPQISADAALQQFGMILDQVEDDLSGVAKHVSPPKIGDRDGRMSPPLDDHIQRHHDGDLTAFTRGHRLKIDSAGRVEIFDRRTRMREFPDE